MYTIICAPRPKNHIVMAIGRIALLLGRQFRPPCPWRRVCPPATAVCGGTSGSAAMARALLLQCALFLSLSVARLVASTRSAWAGAADPAVVSTHAPVLRWASRVDSAGTFAYSVEVTGTFSHFVQLPVSVSVCLCLRLIHLYRPEQVALVQ